MFWVWHTQNNDHFHHFYSGLILRAFWPESLILTCKGGHHESCFLWEQHAVFWWWPQWSQWSDDEAILGQHERELQEQRQGFSFQGQGFGQQRQRSRQWQRQRQRQAEVIRKLEWQVDFLICAREAQSPYSKTFKMIKLKDCELRKSMLRWLLACRLFLCKLPSYLDQLVGRTASSHFLGTCSWAPAWQRSDAGTFLKLFFRHA